MALSQITNMSNASNTDNSSSKGRPPRLIISVGLPLLVLVAGTVLAVNLIKTAPKVQRKPPARHARLVETQPVRLSVQKTVVHAMGTVQPAQEVELYPRVAGEIIATSPEFLPGGRFKREETILQIDPTDYELAARQRESDVAKAKSDLSLELGQQTVAEREYELLGETISEKDRDLVLRQPQLEKVQAALQTAEAALDQARLNLERTKVKAPFNATVRSRKVNAGTQVTAATALAILTGSDTYWILATVPTDQLKWIQIPGTASEAGSTVRIFNETAWGPDERRVGRVARLLSDLEEEGRMAQLLIALDDPLALLPQNAGQPSLILGAYVRVEIEGTELNSVIVLDRQLLRDGNQVWVMNNQNQLEIRDITIAFRGRDQVYISDGLEAGDQLVTTDLAAPVEGMPLRTQDSLPPEAGEKQPSPEDEKKRRS
jgi:RND family efflux transporter MFP subunit